MVEILEEENRYVGDGHMLYKKMPLILVAAFVLILTACSKKKLETVEETEPPVEQTRLHQKKKQEEVYLFNFH